MTKEKTIARIIARINEAENCLSFALESIEKKDFNELENQLDIAASECAEALSMSEHLTE